MSGTQQWLAEGEKAQVKEEKYKLDKEQINNIIDKLSEKNLDALDLSKEYYKEFSNTDLGSVILRFEQNALQLKKIINSLKED